MKVRTRFAPSPTGFLHVGGVRTALFAWLVARQAGGQFILRIEDTDRSRHVEESENHIMESLKWLGLEWDEGPIRQSERLDIYKQWAQKLIDTGRAYWDVSSPEDLEKLREAAKGSQRPFRFIDHRPSETPEGNFFEKYPLRFKSEPKSYSWHDEVMGEAMNHVDAVDDFIIIKSDGYPTYNFAHIVDDHLMDITYVIRSQEFMASMPKFLNLYDALGIAWPKFATLPYVLGSDGKKKLSKRDGAKDILDYRKDGYLPEAMLSFLATLGWNDGTEQEIFTVNELIKKFSLDRVQRSGAKFDEQRLTWINGHFIREMPLEELYKKVENFWPKAAKTADEAYKKQVLSLVQERLKYFDELPQLTEFFFEDLPVDLKLIEENKQLSRFSHDELTQLLKNTCEMLVKSDFTEQDLAQKLNQLLTDLNQKPGILFSLIRIATTWAPASPGLAETLSVLGKDKSLDRINKSLAILKTKA